MTRPRVPRRSDRRPRRPGRRLPPLEAVSAGGVVFRRGKDGPEIVLVGRTEQGLWALPKGTPDGDETIEETALREVREETGLEVRIIDRVGEIRYRFTDPSGRLINKIVYHYLMEPIGGDVSLHDDEFDVVRWCHISEAEQMLTHRNQTPLLHRASELIATLPV